MARKRRLPGRQVLTAAHVHAQTPASAIAAAKPQSPPRTSAPDGRSAVWLGVALLVGSWVRLSQS